MTYAPSLSMALGVLAGIGLLWLLSKLIGLISLLNLWRKRVVNMYQYGYSKQDRQFQSVWVTIRNLEDRVYKLEEKRK